MDGIEIIGVGKTYSVEGRTLEVLKDLSLTVPAGRTTVLVGRSGCGKTTLLRLIAGLEPPDAGEIRVPEHMKVAMVFQEPRLMPWLNVMRNIEFGLPRDAVRREDTLQMIHTVGLDGFEKAMPRQLSGGMQQRVALARALMVKPKLLLMDEPFAALDYFTRADMQREVLRLKKDLGVGMLFVTHSLDEALLLGDDIAIVSGGRITHKYPVDKSPESTASQKLQLLNAIE